MLWKNVPVNIKNNHNNLERFPFSACRFLQMVKWMTWPWSQSGWGTVRRWLLRSERSSGKTRTSESRRELIDTHDVAVFGCSEMAEDNDENGRTTPASIRKGKPGGKMNPSPKKGQCVTCTVRLLDGTDFEEQFDKKAKGQQVRRPHRET